MLTIFKPEYMFTITHEPDGDYRKYLERRLRPYRAAPSMCAKGNALSLDISLDDDEGDVMAGLAALTRNGQVYIDLLWVHDCLRGQGIGRRLMQMAEAEAIKRGCALAYVSVGESALNFYQKLGYTVSGKLQDFRGGQSFYYLQKPLAREDSAQKDLA